MKALGAKWDHSNRTWFVPPGVELEPFGEWLVGTVSFPKNSQFSTGRDWSLACIEKILPIDLAPTLREDILDIWEELNWTDMMTTDDLTAKLLSYNRALGFSDALFEHRAENWYPVLCHYHAHSAAESMFGYLHAVAGVIGPLAANIERENYLASMRGLIDGDSETFLEVTRTIISVLEDDPKYNANGTGECGVTFSTHAKTLLDAETSEF